jgi:hypothetical protein
MMTAKEKKDRYAWLVVMIALAIGLTIYYSRRTLGLVTTSAPPLTSSPSEPATHKITYRVTGCNLSDVSFTNETSGFDHHKASELSFSPHGKSNSIELTFRSGTHAYMTVQNGCSWSSIVAEILMDGSVVKRSTCSGEYCIANVGGTVP